MLVSDDEGETMTWARHFVTGLLGKARALFHGLGPKGEYPSRSDWPCDLDVEDAIDRWHNGPEDGSSIHEYLGWSRDEYLAWVADPDAIPQRPLAYRE